MRVAEDLMGGFPDGLRVVELGSVRDPDVLVDQIAAWVGSGDAWSLERSPMPPCRS
jgi:hypothetical protein